MYSLFLKNKIINSSALLLFLLLLRLIHFFIEVEPYSGPAGLLYLEWFSDDIGALMSWVLATVLLIIQLCFILLISIEIKISSEVTLVPGLVFVLFVSLIPELGVLNPLIFANTFILFALHQLFSVSPRNSSGKQIFNAGCWIAIATLFYSSYFALLIGAVSAVNIIRSYRIKDIKVLVFGFLMPFFLMGTYYFWNDRLHDFFGQVFFDVGLFSIGYLDLSWHLATVILVGILLLAVMVNMSKIMTKKTNIKQNYFKILYWFLFACLPLTLIQNDLGIAHILVLTVPFAFLQAEYLVNSKVLKSAIIINVFIGLIISYQIISFVTTS